MVRTTGTRTPRGMSSRMTFALFATLALALAGASVMAYGQWVETHLPAPPSEKSGGSHVWAGNDNVAIARLSLEEGPATSVNLTASAFTLVPPGKYTVDEANRTVTFDPDVSMPEAWHAALEITKNGVPVGLHLVTSSRLPVTVSDENATEGAMDLVVRIRPELLTVEVPPVGLTAASADCTVEWRYTAPEEVVGDPDYEGGKEGLALRLNVPPEGAMDVTFSGGRGRCPNLQVAVDYVGLWDRPT